MDTTEQQLEILERRMVGLRVNRTIRIDCAKLEIQAANREYDTEAVLLARQINELREQLEAEKPATPIAPIRSHSESQGDPEWSQADIDHFNELKKSGNRKSAKAAR